MYTQKQIVGMIIGVLLILVGGRSPHAAATPCLSHEQFMGEIVLNYFLGQGVSAGLCDALGESSREPNIKKFNQAHRRVLAAHDTKFEKFTAPVEGLVGRLNTTPQNYLLSRTAQIWKQIDAQGGINLEKCNLFYTELQNREKSWDHIMGGVLLEYMAWKDEYLCRPEQ